MKKDIVTLQQISLAIALAGFAIAWIDSLTLQRFTYTNWFYQLHLIGQAGAVLVGVGIAGMFLVVIIKGIKKLWK